MALVKCLPGKQITLNFNSDEFACKCHDCDGGEVSVAFVMKLQRLRNDLAMPIRIYSGTRCADHNQVSGGADDSRHLLGDAADIKLIGRVLTASLRHKIVSTAMRLDFKGIGIRANTIHLDDRAAPALWTYEA